MEDFRDEWDLSSAEDILGTPLFNSVTNKLYAALHPITLGRFRAEGSFEVGGYVFEWRISNLKEAKLPLDEVHPLSPDYTKTHDLILTDLSHNLEYDLDWDGLEEKIIDNYKLSDFINAYGVGQLYNLEDEIREVLPRVSGYLQGDSWKFEMIRTSEGEE